MKVKLNNRAIIKIAGKDALTFLQSQFSNDLHKSDSLHVQINAYCQHQGKVISILWIFKKNNNLYISLPKELKETVIKKLEMYRMMADVRIEDFSSKVNQYGLIDEKNYRAVKINKNLSLLTTRDDLVCGGELNEWDLACIHNHIPEIYVKTSEKFTPQILNLDIEELGVSFTKGCYPGQEVVARMHYLGKPKRRLFRFHSSFKVSIGDSLNVSESQSVKSSGEVVRVAKKDGDFYFLGIFEVSYINNQIYLNNDQTKSVNLIHEQ